LKIHALQSRRCRSIASWRVLVISARYGTRCWNVTTCLRRRQALVAKLSQTLANVEMFVEALAELSDMPLRVSALVHGGVGSGLRAVFERAGLPASSYPAFREAVEALREAGFDAAGAARLKRRIVERVLTRCGDEADVDTAPLLTLLRRFVAEAARDEARILCQEVSADDIPDPAYERAAA
jgi:hypothetical protein